MPHAAAGETYDVVIVGAGPAGCAAAYDLRLAHLSVLLLDKRSFPRVKPCAGALTIKTIKALRYSVLPVVRHVCHDFRVGLRYERSNVFRSRFPVTAMTVRSEFDAFCLEQCIKAGVRFRQVPGVEAIAKHGERWTVSTGAGDVHARYLIGADGANSRVRRLLNRNVPVQFGLALETMIPTPRAHEYPMQMDLGVVERGYGWVFPKGDHLNVGLYTLAPTMDKALEKLAEYCERRAGHRFDPAVHDVHGHKIPYGGKTFRHSPGDAMLVGDAAGLIDPLMGEGIYNAVRSGQLAASAIVGGAAGTAGDAYAERIREVTGDLLSYDFETRVFYAHVSRGYHCLNLPPVRYALMKGFALGLPVRSIKRRVFLLPFLRPRHYLSSSPEGRVIPGAPAATVERVAGRVEVSHA